MKQLTLRAKLFQAALFVAVSTLFMALAIELPGGATIGQLCWSRGSDALFNGITILLRDQVKALIDWPLQILMPLRNNKGVLGEAIRTFLEILEISLMKVPLYMAAAGVAGLGEVTVAKGMFWTAIGSVALWMYAKKYVWLKEQVDYQRERFGDPTSRRGRVLKKVLRARRG